MHCDLCACVREAEDRAPLRAGGTGGGHATDGLLSAHLGHLWSNQGVELISYQVSLCSLYRRGVHRHHHRNRPGHRCRHTASRTDCTQMVSSLCLSLSVIYYRNMDKRQDTYLSWCVSCIIRSPV